MISVKGIKAIGNQLSSYKIKNINQLDPIPYTPLEKTPIMDLEVNDEENIESESVENEKSTNNQEGQTEIEF